LHEGPVNVVKFNDCEMALASGGADRTVKYWNLDKFNLISQTRPDATPIQSILFYDDGKNLFSAAHESLKVKKIKK
jgi:katanin p80 WD40 repeat-containing subunit B1